MRCCRARTKSVVDGAVINYRQCSADSLSVKDDAFDIAVCQQGLQFFADRVRALRELRRVLRSGGRAGVSVWCEIDSCEPFAALETAITEVLGADDAAGYRNGPWGLVDGERLQDEMSDAGFADVVLSRDEINVAFGSTDHLIGTLGAAPVGAKVLQLDLSAYHALRSVVEDATAGLARDGVIRGTTTAHTVIGTA